jgi:glycerol-3-phosphate acyltransferase PlsX
MIIGVDAMGGDNAPKEIVEAVNAAIKNSGDLVINLYGDEEKINQFLVQSERVNIIHTSDYVDMGEKDAIRVVRSNKTASIILAMNDLRDKKIDALVSAGPTQVIVACSYIVVKRLPGVRRLALAPIVSDLSGNKKILLDVGASPVIDPMDLVDFAKYASVVAKTVLNIEDPKCALLNIGTEAGKGREFDVEAYELLSKTSNINFICNVESSELLTTKADIILQDGWTNNIAIKAFEGATKIMKNELKKVFTSSFLSKIGSVFMSKSIKKFKKAFGSVKVGGAMVFGLNGIMVKAHGSSTKEDIEKAINESMVLVSQNILTKMQEVLTDE